MPRFIDLTGQQIKYLTVLNKAGHKGKFILWELTCVCKKQVFLTGDCIAKIKKNDDRSGSCGCIKTEKSKNAPLKRITHGKTGTKIYRIWFDMKRRCSDVSRDDYPRYGGKGISVSKEWMKFQNFYNDMGDPPHGMSIDRIDSKGNYCKENCRWATIIQQNNNRSNNRFEVVFGEKITMSNACRKYKVSYDNVLSHIHVRKMSLEGAIIREQLKCKK